jgi:nucleoside-diphosphate-sugar epimerase
VTVLVTGSDGYIGSVLVPFLLARGHAVLGLDTGFFRDSHSPGIDQAPWQTIRKDVRDLEAVDLEDVTAVVHLAELSNDPLAQLEPDLTREINHGGTMHLARLAEGSGIERLVYASSCSVYGVALDGEATEQSPVNPQTTYAACKALVERDLVAMAGDSFSPVILRNGTAYGASPAMRLDLVLNNLAGSAWAAGEVRVQSDGSPWRPLVHVEDIARAVACALEAPRHAVHAEVFNVGATRENYRIREIAEIVAGAFPGAVVSIDGRSPDARSYRVCFDKIDARLPGFACEWTAERGARELRSHFERIELPWDAVSSRSFTRLEQIGYLRETGRLDDRLFWQERCVSAS